MSVFTEGTEVTYGIHCGIIEFVCDSYVTIVIGGSKHVSILVYRNQPIC